MIDPKHVVLLIWVTILLDVALVAILATQPLDAVDAGFVVSMLITHALFYVALVSKTMWLLDILHYVLFAALVFSLFLSNTYLVGVCLALLVSIQVMWRVCGKCPLNEDGYVFPFSNELEIGSLVYTVLLAYKMVNGNRVKKILPRNKKQYE